MTRTLSLSRGMSVVTLVFLTLTVGLPLSAHPRGHDEVEGQPLAANADRLLKALEFLGAPLPNATTQKLQKAIETRDTQAIQTLLDAHVLLQVTINPEARVKAARGSASANLQQHGFVPVLVKIMNQSTIKKRLNISSPQAGPVYSGGAAGNVKADLKHFLQAEMFTNSPMTPELSGLAVEYALALLSSTEAGKREATLAFDVGMGTQDLGFRGEVPVLFDVAPAVPVRVAIRDEAGQPTVGHLTIRDAQGRVYPSQAKRLAPDFFFQPQIYRPDGGTVLLPPGRYTVTSGRGPEYRMQTQTLVVDADPAKAPTLTVTLQRWIHPRKYGWFSGDHHIHSAGCAHYTNPTEGVFAKDMFLHVKGEGLNVGCCLTWGPCYEFQRQFFEPQPNKLSDAETVIKYDVEISGFGSQALGHVCLLNLKDQTYPGSEGTKERGWPTWTTPAMKWAKAQGGVTGYAHSASGLQVNASAASQRLMAAFDKNGDGVLDAEEAAHGLLPDDFKKIDEDGDGQLTLQELATTTARVSRALPHYAIPQMDGIGAQEICVTTAHGLCDFISAMNTERHLEWNCWYHIMNCGFPLKVSGETDFPCISGSRVGQGRVYVHLGDIDRVDFTAWCEGLRAGRSYISDGYAHALAFTVNGAPQGPTAVELARPETVQVRAKVAFAREMPLGTAPGVRFQPTPRRKVEVVVNGYPVAEKLVPADDQVHDLEFSVPIAKSSWVAVRSYPQLHTNPVTVLVDGKPIRASRRSAQWCAAVIEQLWRMRGPGIAAHERREAEATFRQALETYRRIAAECDPQS